MTNGDEGESLNGTDNPQDETLLEPTNGEGITTRNGENTTHNDEETPLIGDILPIIDYFQGKVFTTERSLQRWLDVTKKCPISIQTGAIQQIGVQGIFVTYE